MSKKKRIRLNDQPIEGFADLEDELPAAGPAHSPVHAAEATPPPRERVEPFAAAASPPATARSSVSRRADARRSTPALPWGTVYTASVIAAGIGLGGVALLVTGGAPDGAWKPADLLAVQNYLSPAAHPLNLVALLAVIVGLLAAVGGRALGSALHRLESDRSEAARLVDRLTALRLDNEGPWTDAVLSDHPSAGTFAAEVLGAWRLQGARLRRVNGVEGEVHRLQKALTENTREVLTGRFDSPAIGSLADEMVRFLDARNADAEELVELRRHNRDESEAIVALIQEARGWNRTTLEQIGTQGAALERMARRLEDLGSALRTDGRAPAGQAATLLADIRRDLDALGASQAKRVTGLDDLAAQASKLAFQIAMEVARLGPRGERLQPMSQSLEDLVTTLRQALDSGAAPAGGPTVPGAVLGKIDALSQQLGRGETSPEALEEIGRSGPVVGKVAANLADVARRFQVQAERLVKLGESLGSLTGVPFDASAPPTGQAEPAAENGLRVVAQDPFCRDGAARTQVDPFAVDVPLAAPSARPMLEPAPIVEALPTFVDVPLEDTPGDDSFVIERTSPGGSILDRNPAEAVAPLELEPMVPTRDEQPHTPAARDLASDQDRIYDLSEFGAVRLEQARSALSDQQDDEVHELAEFGAVRVA